MVASGHQEGGQADIGDEGAVDEADDDAGAEAAGGDADFGQGMLRITTAATSAAMATTEPIEIDLAGREHDTMPIAMMVIGAVCWTMLKRLLAVRKPSSLSTRTGEGGRRSAGTPT